ncbi:cation transporter [Methyloceanibacter superfactus]|uniref:cation transporter n=1 Tax=Methyloceanibacter superfactus TaxID=1774969 RepID=UPI000B2EB6CA|nr:cation transporter [Methyloceanibacter superfactus]
MSAGCCNHTPEPDTSRLILWIALAINAAMFAVEIVAGVVAGSVSLHADALDFLADSFNYAISLSVIGLALTWRARAAMFKGLTMGALGLWVIGEVVWQIVSGRVPEPFVMGAVGTAALLANAGVAVLLYRFRSAESNLRSAWICSRNDVLGNLAVLLAAAGVLGTGTLWPDVIVASIMRASPFKEAGLSFASRSAS